MPDYTTGGGLNAMLVSLNPPATVLFSFNPDKISIARQADLKDLSTYADALAKDGSLGRIVRKTPLSTLTLSDVILQGAETKPMGDQLLQWVSPSGGVLGQAFAGAVSTFTSGRVNHVARLPLLQFQWGPPGAAFSYLCILNSATVTYVRFSRIGVPVRAKVSLTLKEMPSPVGTLPTNPTSGGLTNRRVCVLTEGETLHSVAQQYYGDPQAWRAVAQANDIDDPLRTRPGRRVYLPNPDELPRRDDDGED